MTQFKWHEADSKLVHGIADTAAILINGSTVGGDLSGTLPNPTLANSILGAWTPWTPTLAQGVTTDIAKAVTRAKYARIGRTIFFNVRLDVTGAGTLASDITITLPVTAASSGYPIGSGGFFDASGNVMYAGMAYVYSTLLAAIFADGQSSYVGTSPNIALAAGDTVNLSGTYEAAA